MSVQFTTIPNLNSCSRQYKLHNLLFISTTENIQYTFDIIFVFFLRHTLYIYTAADTVIANKCEILHNIIDKPDIYVTLHTQII